jgi:hypothetical protein
VRGLGRDDLVQHLAGVGLLGERLDLVVGLGRQLHLLGHARHQAQQGGHLALVEQVDLQVQVVAALVLLGGHVLADEDHDGQHDRLDRHQEQQEGERVRVDLPHPLVDAIHSATRPRFHHRKATVPQKRDMRATSR